VAKKVRTPTPRPRQQGPRRRESRPSAGRSLTLDRRTLLAAGGVAVVVVAIVLAVTLTGGGGGGSSSATAASKDLAAAGCTYDSFASEGRGHVSDINAKITYKTFPPTSGTHYDTPAVWNRYSDPLVLAQEVHNLEHGGVIVQYGDKVPQATVDQIVSFYDASPNAMLLAPLPRLGNKIALTAWTHLATCTRFDEKAFSSFRDAFRGKGPERFPVDMLKPGSGPP
jgi:hypothetical protein